MLVHPLKVSFMSGTLRKVIFKSTVTSVLVVLIIAAPFTSLVRVSYAPPPWWNLDWNFRKSFTIDHTKVVSDLTDFPVLLDIVDSNLKTKARSDGGDIVFTADNNATLDYEIESYEASTGHLVAWIKIPLLSSSADTEVYMYYGNPDSDTQQNPNGVWAQGFLMVQHLEETSTARKDSTINGINGTAYGGVAKLQRIDGADYFDGVDDYISIPSATSLNPQVAITIEMWMNLSLTGNYMNLASKGAYSQYYLRLGPAAGSAYWYAKFADGTAATIEGNLGWMTSTLHQVTAILDTQNQTMKLYLDGVQKLTGTFPSGKNMASSSYALQVSDSGSRRVKGMIDEIRVSGVARPPEWIKTGFNNQLNPSAFYSVGVEEPSPSAGAPLVFENPSDETTDANTNPRLSVRVLSPNGNNMTVIIKERTASGWVELAHYDDAPDGTYFADATSMKNLATTYYWGAYVDDGVKSTDKTFALTTTVKVLKQKWTVTTAYPGVSGVLAADINNDGFDEVLCAGKNGTVALNGTNGAVLWNVTDTSIGDHTQPQMADLNKDGILEIVIPLETPAGLLVLHANNGSTYWRRQGDLGKETFSGPVIFDIDGNGYPTIFMGATDTSKGLNGNGRLTSLSYDGNTILHQIFAWRPCGGGLSIADTDGDGAFELYMGDRNMYLNNPEYGDSDYGKGLLSLWAGNLSLRWYRPEMFCSSQKPMIADVDNDGILDIITGDLNGGVAVLNATDGSTIRMTLGISQVAPTHYQPSIYDIDGDGNLEMLMADPHDTSSNDLVVWDLVKWKVDARFYIGKNFYGPQIADVTGDGIMDIIACNYKSIFIIDRSYRVVDGIVGLSGDISSGNETKNIDGISMLAGTLNYAVTQDVDGDGYSEVVVTTQSGTIYAFDTPAHRPSLRPRSEVQFYSEYRRGVAEYVQPQGGQTPTISSPQPANLADSVPVSTTQLSFTLTDYQGDLMNYTVTTAPDVGSTTKMNQSNGRYSLNVSGLSYSTTYTWRVTGTDGIHATNMTFTFMTQPFERWFDEKWQYRKRVVIDHNKVVGNQSDFPVLVDLSDADLIGKAKSDGTDIVFTDSNGSKLAQQIELYNNSTGHLVAWIRVPQLSSSTDTTLYMYYGNPQATSSQNASSVWDTGFVMVQHLADNSTMRYDSTVNGNNGIAYGTIAKSAGKMDGADYFDGIDDYLQVANSPTLNPSTAITIELWMNLSSTATYMNLVNKGLIGQQYYNQYYLRAGPSAGNVYWYVKFSDQTVATIGGSTGWATNVWHYIVAQVDTPTSTIKVYVDGILKLNGSFPSGKNLVSTLNPFVISDVGSRRIKGTIDEIRISNVSRSSGWILTSYNNEKSPATFCTVFGEEMVPESPVVYAESPSHKSAAVSPSLSQLSFNLTGHDNSMNYTVTTMPYVGSAEGFNVSSGRFYANVTGLQYSTTYSWSVNVTDGIHWTHTTFTFSTLPSEPPTQSAPQLIENVSGLVCTNQSTSDPDGDKVTNIYHWYKNNVSTTNLLLPFDTNSTTLAKDYSGCSNDGLLVRGVTWTNGKVGGAYNFSRGFIQISGSDTLDGGGQWSEITLEEWIYLSSSQSGTRTLARIPSYEIGITGNTIYASIWTATGNPMVSGFNQIAYNVTLQNSVWYHVAVTYKRGVALTLYLNGLVVANKTLADSATLNYNIQPGGPNPLYIGWFDYFKGLIDDVRIHPKAFSAEQINQRYLETKDGSSNSSTMVAQEIVNGETWRCEVTPNDGRQDGTTKSSNIVTLGINDLPIISSYYPLSADRLLRQSNSHNESVSFRIACFDPDTDTFTVEWWVNSTMVKNETGVNSSSYLFDSTFYQQGAYVVMVVVKDNWLQTTQQWTVQIQWL